MPRDCTTVSASATIVSDTRAPGELAHIAAELRVLARPIDSLHADPANARLHGARNVQAIVASLRKFGQRTPIVVQRKGMVVRAGNGRLAAAKALAEELRGYLVEGAYNGTPTLAAAVFEAKEWADWVIVP